MNDQIVLRHVLPAVSRLHEDFEGLLSMPCWSHVRGLFILTKRYDAGVDLMVELERLLEAKRTKIGEDKYREYYKKIIFFKLELLDRADRWDAFIDVFEYCLQERRYEGGCWVPSEKPIQPDDVYVLNSDGKYKSVHFLYELRFRYDVNRRKIARALKGHKTGNLMHDTASSLSNEDVNYWINLVFEHAARGERLMGVW